MFCVLGRGMSRRNYKGVHPTFGHGISDRIAIGLSGGTEVASFLIFFCVCVGGCGRPLYN